MKFNSSLTPLLIALSAWPAVSASQQLKEGTTGTSEEKEGIESLLLQSLRRLDVSTSATTRACNEVIGTMTAAEVNGFVGLMADFLFPPTAAGPNFTGELAKTTISPFAVHDFRIVKVCMSCNDVVDGTVPDTAHPYGFSAYCGDDKYAADAPQSALAFLPLDPDDGTKLKSAGLSGVINMHSTLITVDLAPTVLWPASFTDYLGANSFEDVLGLMVDYIAAMIGASFGAVVVSPDYVGYGESEAFDRTYTSKQSYSQAATLGWLATKKYVEDASDGCTELKDTATVTGYSEGGYAAVCASFALDQIDVAIQGLYPGGAPYDPVIQSGSLFEKYQDETTPSEPLDLLVMPYLGYAASNDFPFFPNSGTGQDYLSSEWMNTGNVQTDVLTWFSAGSTVGRTFVAFLPQTNLASIWNSDLRDMYAEARANNERDACLLQNNLTNFLCDTMQGASLIEDLEAYVEWPTLLCHSDDDTTVTVDGLPTLPFATNDNVQRYTAPVPQLGPSGSHIDAFIPCVLSPVLNAFLPTSGNTLVQSALSDTSACKVETAAPVATTAPGSTTAPVATPTDNSGAFGLNMQVIAGFLILAPLLIL